MQKLSGDDWQVDIAVEADIRESEEARVGEAASTQPQSAPGAAVEQEALESPEREQDMEPTPKSPGSGLGDRPLSSWYSVQPGTPGQLSARALRAHDPAAMTLADREATVRKQAQALEVLGAPLPLGGI